MHGTHFVKIITLEFAIYFNIYRYIVRLFHNEMRHGHFRYFGFDTENDIDKNITHSKADQAKKKCLVGS